MAQPAQTCRHRHVSRQGDGQQQLSVLYAAMNERALERLRIEGDLRNALERRELLLYYQPQVDLRTGRVVGMEALIRWKHSQLGMVSLTHFIDLAEETGLIFQIGAWVTHTACLQNKAWQLMGLGYLPMSVNLSTRQFFQHNLVQSVAQVLEETGVELAVGYPQRFEIDRRAIVYRRLRHRLFKLGLPEEFSDRCAEN